MAPLALLRTVARRESYTCSRCVLQASKPSRRHIGMKYLQKVADAEAAWQTQAHEIKAGRKKSMLSILEKRGLIHQIAGNRDRLEELMTSKRLGAYVGIDPTASSLHVGHMLPLMAIFWLYVHGYHGVTLLGGATSKIGDPTDRLVSRHQEHSSIRTANMVAMHYQLKKIWLNVEKYGKKYGYEWEWAWKRELVNNNAWMNKLTIMEVLQTLGPGLRMGTMLAKDTVRNKMEKGDGMSFAEFTYPILQSWDWWHMYHTKGVQMQIGGADQYGNITAGIDSIKYISQNHPDPVVREGKGAALATPIGFTVPLLTTSSGQKLGKSAGNAVWLDKDRTNVFDLYAYFVKQSDADVGKFLRYFTFMPIEDIEALMEEHKKSPPERKAQRKLAYEFVELVHGEEEAKTAEWQHSLLFAKASGRQPPVQITKPESPKFEGPLTARQTLNAKRIAETTNPSLTQAPSPTVVLPRSLILKRSIARVVRAAGLAGTNTEATRLIAAGAIYIGGEPSQKRGMNENALSWTPVHLWVVEDNSIYLIKDDLLLLRRGKGNIRIVKVVSDDVWRASGMDYPGQSSDSLEELQPGYEAPPAYPPPIGENQNGHPSMPGYEHVFWTPGS